MYSVSSARSRARQHQYSWHAESSPCVTSFQPFRCAARASAPRLVSAPRFALRLTRANPPRAAARVFRVVGVDGSPSPSSDDDDEEEEDDDAPSSHAMRVHVFGMPTSASE